MQITKLGISLVLLIALALAARFAQMDKTVQASSRPTTAMNTPHSSSSAQD